MNEYTWLDAPYFNIIDNILSIQSYFITQAWFIARIVVFLAIGMAAINYAMNGQGLKSSLTKLIMAFVVFTIIINFYPQIINGMNSIIFKWSNDSTSQDINNAFDVAGDIADEKRMSLTQTRIMEALGTTNISEFFAQKIFDEKHSFLSPNVSLKMILFTVVAILDKSTQYGIWELPQLILNLLCAICVVVCGIFALCEYFICTLEYCLVTGVGVLMLPFMLWDGTKFLSEKFMSALVGFFLKLLFCTICVLLTLYGFLGMAITPYTGAIEEIVSKVFLCVFYFLLCKQGPNLATALLTGTPTLNMGAAVGAAAGAGAAVGAIFGKGAGLAAKGTFGAAGAITQAASAGGAAGLLGGSGKDKFGAVMSSFGNSAMEGLKSSGGSLTKSLLSSKGGAAGGGGAGGFNPHSQLEKFKQKNSDGSRQSLTEHLTGRQEAGTNAGIDYMARKEAKQAGKKS